MGRQETFYELIRRQGISRRNFMKFCSLSAASLGLAPAFAGKIAYAMETKPRVPVLWLHGLECTCCTESFIRSAHPLAKDVIAHVEELVRERLLENRQTGTVRHGRGHADHAVRG